VLGASELHATCKIVLTWSYSQGILSQDDLLKGLLQCDLPINFSTLLHVDSEEIYAQHVTKIALKLISFINCNA
jgi:hypothetical protein